MRLSGDDCWAPLAFLPSVFLWLVPISSPLPPSLIPKLRRRRIVNSELIPMRVCVYFIKKISFGFGSSLSLVPLSLSLFHTHHLH